MIDRPTAGRLPDFADLGRRTAQETVVESLREAILAGLLSGGTRLVQSELSARLGVSTTPVREAMRQLAAEGLIRFDPYRGAVVHTPTVDEVREVYELRMLLEPIAMRKAMDRISPELLEEARELQETMKQTTDAARWVMLNRSFHATMLRSAASPRLVGIIEGLMANATSQVALSIKADARRMTDGNREHRQILQALARRDGAALDRLVKEHLQLTVSAVETVAAAHTHEPTAVPLMPTKSR